MAELFVWGVKSITGDLTITAGIDDDLTFSVDGTSYTIYLTARTYSTSVFHTTSEFVDELNVELTANAVPVTARTGGVYGDTHYNVVVFEHNNPTSTSTINNFTGGMYGVIW